MSKRHLHRRNWYRYLWIQLCSNERFYARERAFLAHVFRSDNWTPSTPGLLASSGRLIATTIRGADQNRRMLGL